MDYLDFELRVGPARPADAAGAPAAGAREYPVEVVRSPAGEARGTMRLPFEGLALQNHLQAIEIAVLRSSGAWRDVGAADAGPGAGGTGGPAPVAEFGRQLFQAVLAGPVHESFRRSQDRARAAGKGLRLRLRIEAPDLAALPWEYLYDPGAGDYVCLSNDTPLVRYLEFDQPPEALLVRPPLAVLVVVASPSDRPALDVARERQRIEAATERLRAAGTLALTWLEGSTWRDLQRAMRRGPYHVLHFVGHGGYDPAIGEGVVALAGEDGRTALLSATQLGRLLADHDALRLVVLNACLGARGSGADVFSSTAATLVRRGVPAVVAMQYEISDRAAVEFARSLYEAVADGLPVDAAVSEARKAISFTAASTVEWGTPVLYLRAPDGVLFRIDQTGARPVPPPPTPKPAEPPAPAGPPLAERVRALRGRLLMAHGADELRAIGYEVDALAAEHPMDVGVRLLRDQVAEALRPPAPLFPASVGGASAPAPQAAARRRPGLGKWGAGAGLAAAALLAVVTLRRGDEPAAVNASADTAAVAVAVGPAPAAASAPPATAAPTLPAGGAARPVSTARPTVRPRPTVKPVSPAPGPAVRPDTAAGSAGPDAAPGAEPGAETAAAGPRRSLTADPAPANAAPTPTPGDPGGEATVRAVVFESAGGGAWTVRAVLTARGSRAVKRDLGCTLPEMGRVPERRVVLSGLVDPAAKESVLTGRFRVRTAPARGVYKLVCAAEDGAFAYGGRLTVQ